jgi:hypothetical protein
MLNHTQRGVGVSGLLLALLGVGGCDSPAPMARLEVAAVGSVTMPRQQPVDDVDRWWRLVEAVGMHGTADEREARLRFRLELLDDTDVRSFVAFYVDRLAAVQRQSLWLAASDAFRGCDHEFFGWLRAELVFRGRAEYERALTGEATFAGFGAGPTSDAGAAVLAQWRYRFPAEPLPEPRVAPPPDDAVETPTDDVAAEYPTPESLPSRSIPPPSGLPSFCLNGNPDVPRFTRVPVNGQACSRGADEWHEDPPPPSLPVRESRLCYWLRQESDPAYGSDEPAPCGLVDTLPHGYAIYSAGPPSVQTYFLVHVHGDMAERVAVLGTYAEGNGYRREWVRGHRFDGAAGEFTFMWRAAVTDWDLGVEEFTATEECMAIRCEREGAGHLCSVQSTLRSYGGLYHVPLTDDDRWPAVGAPVSQWDCRPG